MRIRPCLEALEDRCLLNAGSINAVIDGTTPVNQAVAGDQSVVTGKFKIVTSGSGYTVGELKFAVPAGSDAIINSVSLWDGSHELGDAAYDSVSGYFDFAGLNDHVLANTTQVLNFSENLGTPYTDGVVNTDGLNVTPTLLYMKTTDSQGVVHDAGPEATSTDPSVVISDSETGMAEANGTYVYKSVPTFSAGALPSGQGSNLTAGATVTVYSWDVTADKAGAIALKQETFQNVIQITPDHTPTLDNYKLYRDGTDITNQVTIHVSPLSPTGDTLTVVFDTEGVTPAGTKDRYSLTATPHGFVGGDKVTTWMYGDDWPVASDGTNNSGYLENTAGVIGLVSFNQPGSEVL